jgi:hypothetical protein
MRSKQVTWWPVFVTKEEAKRYVTFCKISGLIKSSSVHVSFSRVGFEGHQSVSDVLELRCFFFFFTFPSPSYIDGSKDFKRFCS